MKLFDSVFLYFPCDGTRGQAREAVFLILEPVTLAALPPPPPLHVPTTHSQTKTKTDEIASFQVYKGEKERSTWDDISKENEPPTSHIHLVHPL